ncbi:MAG: CoA transferase [Chloroflexi bacterium]|nr:CoA transferase [Chloroflexota bacterium]
MAKLPLENLRVIDLTQVYAGPLASRVLADMGAEVIRVESAFRSSRGGPNPQQGAVYPDGNPGEKPYNRSAYYNELNRNKHSISLDLSNDQGKEIFLKLAQISDVVLENFSPRVMANFGLDYPNLEKIKSDIIMVSISAYGQTGPYRDYVSFGRGIEAMAGLSQTTGYQDSQPLGPGTAYADATAGLHAVFATLVALRYRRQTGKGQHTDLSLRESLSALMGEHIMDHSMNKRSPERKGNHDSAAIFQGCYRCRGDDSWITIALHTEDELRAFCNAIGNPQWTREPELESLLNWRQNQQKADMMIEQWTIQKDRYEAMKIVQQSGVRAGAVLDAADLNRNSHLKGRGFFETVTHPEAGTHALAGMPWKLGQTPGQVRMPAPCFAQHNDYVFAKLLGMSKEEIAQLEAEGIVTKVPIQ